MQKIHAFNIFFWKPLDGCVWGRILWDTSYFRHSNNIRIAKTFDGITLKMEAAIPFR